jgi:hypothetical protein
VSWERLNRKIRRSGREEVAREKDECGTGMGMRNGPRLRGSPPSLLPDLLIFLFNLSLSLSPF